MEGLKDSNFKLNQIIQNLQKEVLMMKTQF